MRRWGVTRDGDSLWWPTHRPQQALDRARPAPGTGASQSPPDSRSSATSCSRTSVPAQLDKWGLGLRRAVGAQPRGWCSCTSAASGRRVRSPSRPGSAASARRWAASATRRGAPTVRRRVPASRSATRSRRCSRSWARWPRWCGAKETGKGQEVDVAIYEAVAALMESTMADFELGGVVRTRSGSVLPGVAPSNVYPTSDGAEVVIAANADTVFVRLCEAMGRPELVDRPALRDRITLAARTWTSSTRSSARGPPRRPCDEVLQDLDANGVPGGRIFTAPDMLDRPAVPGPRHGAARHVDPGLGRADDRRRATLHRDARHDPPPGADARCAHRRGARELLGWTSEEIARLRADGVVA